LDQQHERPSKQSADALVLFGATGDLAKRKIFPALQALVRKRQLDVPVIGVARGRWSLERLRRHVHDSLAMHGGVDPQAYPALCGLLRYVDGDYRKCRYLRSPAGRIDQRALAAALPRHSAEHVPHRDPEAG
jgi:glucose-6-phosphate 1-dehydrogenase